MKRCLLCFQITDESIAIFGDEGKQLGISQIIEKHYGLEVVDETVSILFEKAIQQDSDCICIKCWNITFAFRQLYLTVTASRKVSVAAENVKDEFSDSNESASNEINSSMYQQIFTSLADEIPQEVTNEETQILTFKAEDAKDEIELGKPKKRSKKPIQSTADEDRFMTPEYQLAENSLSTYCNMECTSCKQLLSTWNDMKLHYRTEHKTTGYLICCSRKFNKKVRILEHIVSRHLNPEAFNCEVCRKRYSSRENLKKHKIMRHLPEELRPHKCDSCSKTFSKMYLLTAHKKSEHNTGQKVDCKECDKTFISQKCLQAHIKGIHQNAYVHVCEICAKSFRTKLNYLVHQKLHSDGHRPKIQCTICGKWFQSEESIRSHMRRHREESEIYKCDMCSKVSPNKAALQSHKRYVHLLERNFKCSVCEKAFKKPIELREHMAGHTGSFLYHCPAPGCGKSFNSSANMTSHKKKMHKSFWEAEQKRKME